MKSVKITNVDLNGFMPETDEVIPTVISDLEDGQALLDKVDNIEESAKGITLTEQEIDGQKTGKLIFTDYQDNELVVQGGYAPDKTTIILTENNNLQAKGLQTDNGYLSGNVIEEIITSKGGYLDSYDFGTATPTQQQLTDYAIQNIGTITQASEIWDKTKVINLYDHHTWCWDLNSGWWSDLGDIGVISDANNDGLHGLVTGAPNDGNHLYMGNIDGNGQININGLPQLANTVAGKQDALSVSGYLSLSNNNLSTNFSSSQDDALNSGVDSNVVDKVNNMEILTVQETRDSTRNILYPIAYEPIYGVEWTNNTSTTMTRTDDAVGMTYDMQSDSNYNWIRSDFDYVFPFNQMTRTTINGNTFVYVPSMWFRIKEGNTYTGTNYFDITGVAVSETRGPAMPGYNWYQTKAFYYGAYGAYSDGYQLSSISGVTRANNLSRADARTQAMNVGTGYHQRDLYAGTVLMFLWWIEFATKNSQSVLTGVTIGSRVPTGGTDMIINANHTTGYDYNNGQMVWRGIEDYIGNLYEFEDGITGNGTRGGLVFVSDDYTKYDDYNNGSQMNKLAFNSPIMDSQCLTALGWDKNKPFLVQPIAMMINTNYDTGFCDQAYYNNNIVSYRGSNHSGNTVNYGVSAYFRNSRTFAGAGVGFRLVKEAN